MIASDLKEAANTPSDLFIRKAFVTRVVDGDTVDMTVDLGYHITTTQRFRLKGINAPEKNKDYPGWVKAKAHLTVLIGDGEVTEQSTKADSFGRFLVDLYKDGKSINEQMVEDGFAVPYRAK